MTEKKTTSTTSSKIDICTVDDDFVKYSPRWVAILSDGKIVYQDDFRPGIKEPSAWLRLKKYCEDHSVNITEFWLQFRSNRQLIGQGADGYYFVKSAFGVWGNPDTYHGCVCGIYKDGKVSAIHWKIPEIIPLSSETREVEITSPSLILTKPLQAS